MIPAVPPAVQSDAAIPPKIQAAMSYLHFAEMARNRSCVMSDIPQNGRDLSKAEAEVYDSALTALLEYFVNDDGLHIVKASSGSGPDDPKPPIPAMTP